jgi:hypothetical protein
MATFPTLSTWFAGIRRWLGACADIIRAGEPFAWEPDDEVLPL